ncbi:MAG TPA: S8 family serine peptidase [Puia sp.]|jgi:subtilisin family serine protease|nr:S8 family serine peptidase [Puia sp.]
MATSKKSVTLGKGGGVEKRAVATELKLPKRYTGRMLVRLDREAGMDRVLRSAKESGLNLAVGMDGWGKEADGVVLEKLRVAVVNESAEAKVKGLIGGRNSAFISAEPDRYLRLLQAASKGRGKKTTLKDGSAATWGVQAINVLGTSLTGKGVKVAVLDTGFDFTHPDFSGRTIHRKSFVGTKQAIDKEGHGTHTAAVVGGGKKTKGGARYGVASGARLYIGKIMDDNGEGSDMQALAGIEWALDKGCQVISMSLGASADEGGGYSLIYEQVGQIAAERNCLLIAAVGNESERELGIVAAVNHPANCPSIMAVGGLTTGLEVAEYSCAGTGEGMGQVDIAAPGDDILSAKPGGGYRRQSGTSMATAFVAGLAALMWEQFPKASAGEIWAKMVQQARRLALPASDVGAGLGYVR